MPDLLFSTVLSDSITPKAFFSCTITSFVLGFLLALSYMYKNNYSKSFVLTVALLPAIVQVVMMLVNGNIGTGVAVMGAFSLIRFRSVPGSAREILSIFMAMAIGLATGVGYIGIAVIFTALLIIVNIIYTAADFGERKTVWRQLRITIPEDLDYPAVFDDILKKYTTSHKLLRVKTTNLGSLFQLSYSVVLKNEAEEKKLIDELRCHNGNLDIISSRISTIAEEL